MWQACSWADHLLGLGRRFRFCDGTSRTRPIIISGAPSKVAIKVCVLFIISFEFCDAVCRLTFELSVGAPLERGVRRRLCCDVHEGYCPGGGCQSSTLLPSGSMTHPNFPYSESSVFSSTSQPSSRSA